MRPLLLLSLFLTLTLVPIAGAQDSGLIRCSEYEVLVLLNSLIDFEIFDFSPIETIDDIVRRGTALLDARETSYALLPLCAEAVAMQRRTITLKGDLVGQTALRLAGVAADDNPYMIRFPNLLEDDKSLALKMIIGDREEDIQFEDRGARACWLAELAELDALASDFEAVLSNADAAGDGAGWLDAIDQILSWRIDNMPTLPDCGEAVELGFALSKTTADAAAQFALRHAEVAPESNPYSATLADARAKLASWRDHLKLEPSDYEDAVVVALGPESQLPACSAEQLVEAHDNIDSEVMDLLAAARYVQTKDELVDFANSHMALRDGFLSSAPICAEVFEGAWLTRQALGDTLAKVASELLGYYGRRNPFESQANSKTIQVNKWRRETKAALADADDREEAAPHDGSHAPVCRDGEIAFMIAYLFNDYAGFTSAAFSRETADDLFALFEHSFDFRDKLWRYLPRCRQALKIGMLMREVAGDWVSMLSMDYNEIELEAIPYVFRVRENLDAYDDLRLELLNASESDATAITEGRFYYVTADPYVNIRACASTNCEIVATARYGEGITVIDDSGDWYEVRLEDGGTAFIAGFLMSPTPPQS